MSRAADIDEPRRYRLLTFRRAMHARPLKYHLRQIISLDEYLCDELDFRPLYYQDMSRHFLHDDVSAQYRLMTIIYEIEAVKRH